MGYRRSFPEVANKDAGTRFLISEDLHEQVADKVEIEDFIRTRLRGTSERIALYEVARLKPEVETALNAREVRDSMHFAGRDWLRVFPEDALAVGERRILDFEECDVVIYRGAEAFHAFNNACPHLKLPFFERRQIDEAQLPVALNSAINESLELVCRWHETCFDLQTGAIKTWCTTLNEDGTAPGFEFVGAVSKNRDALAVFPCRVHDGHVWISLE